MICYRQAVAVLHREAQDVARDIKRQFESPFDVCFRDMMTETTRHLLDCGFRLVYCFTQSDEMSLLFHPDDRTFGRKVRKLNTVKAG